MKKNTNILLAFLFAALLFATGCNNHTKETKATEVAKIDTPKADAKPAEPKRGPVINIADTLSIKRMVLTIKDSAATMERVNLKLKEIYGVKLATIIKRNKLKTAGAPVAWYKGLKAPYFFEAGMPVDKKPAKLTGGAYMKEIGVDSIVVAHFYGPYELIPSAYDALKDWLKDRKKKMKGAPYEIYVDDPFDAAGKLKDPYKVQTDIVFSWR
jgi:hypothetical protein